jgi:iron transport multicopper oxidase
VPTLYTVLNSGEMASNPAIYGDYTHSFVLERDEIIDVVVNNLDIGRHPFHLHGHAFQSLYRSDEDAGTFEDSNITAADFPAIPMRRDTLVLAPGGFLVIRFRANNPGMYMCPDAKSLAWL